MDEFIDPEHSNRKRLLALTSAEKTVTCELKRATQNKKRKSRSFGTAVFTPAEVTFALHLYASGDYSVKGAVFYLGQQLHAPHHKHTANYGAAELGRMIEDWFIALEPSEIDALSHSGNPKEKRLISRAATFHSECKLRQWVAEQNILKGLAPSTGSMALHWDSVAISDNGEDELVGALRCDIMLSRNRMWAWRFRGRWGMRYMKIPSRENMSSEEIHAKAFGAKKNNSFFFVLQQQTENTNDMVCSFVDACLALLFSFLFS
jgi:hypothetical protein